MCVRVLVYVCTRACVCVYAHLCMCVRVLVYVCTCMCLYYISACDRPCVSSLAGGGGGDEIEQKVT